ncbi:hypothetical protein E6H29_11340 [Candidatus Bathyarchaeota archaeon]|nr:MAG: hypothetical protein E6H29_11340 [Candidatus Bathyarchaeota archaeon]
MVRTRVKDFAKWKTIFEQHATTRQHNGSKGGYFFRNADNPYETVFLLEWDNLRTPASSRQTRLSKPF